MLVPCSSQKVHSAILISLISSIMAIDRTNIQNGLSGALQTADKAGFKTIVTPLLGVAKAHSLYEALCNTMLKTIRDFASTNPANLNKIIISVFNPQAYEICKEVFSTFRQTL